MRRFLTLATIFLSLLTLALGYKLSVLSQPVRAQAAEVDYQCMGKALAEYMNTVIGGAGNLSHVKLLSPAFNMTSPYFTGIVNAMGDNGANFSGLDAIAGNSYNFGGKRVTQWVNESMSNSNLSGRPVLITETGRIDYGITELREEMGKIQRREGQNYIAGLLFNGLGTNPGFPTFALNKSEIDQVCGSHGACGNIGVNYAVGFGDNLPPTIFGQTAENGMQFALAIATPDANFVARTINDMPASIIPVIRINEGGFENPEIYVNFLKAIDSQVGRTVYAIAGPNEPETETWATPGCAKLKTSLKNAKCKDVKDPEFHTLRPYPTDPCDLSVRETTYMCANQFVAKEAFEVTVGEAIPRTCKRNANGSQTCSFNKTSSIGTSVNLDGAFLPILGNTELVPNSKQEKGSLDLKQRVNNYVSWYLYGAPSLAEEENRFPYYDTPSEQFIYNAVNLSGPIRRLMPWSIQAGERIKQIEDAYNSVENDAGIRHNQVVGCRIGDNTQGDLPTKCYFVNSLSLLVERLTEWKYPTSSLFPVVDIFLENLIPPLEKDFPNAQEYIKSYKTWRDNVFCTPSFLGFYVCSPKLTSPFWSNIFTQTPFSSTEDRKGTLETRRPPSDIHYNQNGDQVDISNIVYTPNDHGDSETLYFAHTEEVAQGSAFLQRTFTPGGNFGDTNTTFESEAPTIGAGCTILETRTNPGDDLHAEDTKDINGPIKGTITYNATFECTFSAPASTTPGSNGDQAKTACLANALLDDFKISSEEQASCDAISGQSGSQTTTAEPICKKDIFVSIPMETQTPKAEEIWNRLVEGDFAIFKRIFPKVGPNSPLEKLIDLPAVTTGKYEVNGGTGDGIGALAGDTTRNISGDKAEIYFPHIGALKEYFLNGIQAALRPKGFAEAPIAGMPIANPPITSPIKEPDTSPGQCSPPLSYNIAYRTTSIRPKSVDEIAALLQSVNPGKFAASTIQKAKENMEENYNTLINRSIGAGYNPAFVLAIWLEETAAGAVGSREFGCPSGYQGFEAQLSCFLGLYDSWSGSDPKFAPCREGGQNPNFEDFMLFFSEGTCKTVESQDRKFCGNRAFPSRLQRFYNLVVQ